MSALPADLWVDLIGRPFLSGGRGPDAFDCYGLLIEVFRRRGRDVMPHNTPGDGELADFVLATVGAEWHRIPEPTPGCGLLFRDRGAARHVGIYLGQDRFIHSNSRLGQVAVERLAAVRSFLPMLGAYEPSEAPDAAR